MNLISLIKQMKRTKLAISLSIIVIIGGASVMIGWIMDIEILKSILPIWVTMKFTTALSFFLSGFILYFISSSIENRSDIAQVGLSITTLMLLLLMATLLISVILNIHTGVEYLFVRETKYAVNSTAPGVPSVGTMINFIIIAVVGILTLLDLKSLYRKMHFFGLTILLTSSLAILGYILSLPLFYYSIDDLSTAMALHTAILFVITGIGFSILGKKDTN